MVAGSLGSGRCADMTGGTSPGREVVLETDRLLLRPWRVGEAVVQRELWTERDPRVPPHRRIDADGRPTVAELEEAIRTDPAVDDRVAGGRAEGRGRRDRLLRAGRQRTGGGRRTGAGVRAAAPGLGPGIRDRGLAGGPGLGEVVRARTVCGPRCGTGTPLPAGCWPSSASPRRGALRWTTSTGPRCSPRAGSDTRAWPIVGPAIPAGKKQRRVPPQRSTRFV